MKIWTYDWVPEMPRGYVRDVRLRWAMEEAGFPYSVGVVPFDNRGAEHLTRQPFAQVPFLQDGDIYLFESGACLLHLAEKSTALMPRDPQGKADTLQWVIAALNSMEMVTVPWWFLQISGVTDTPLDGWVRQRFERLNAVLAQRDWLAAGRFTVADILMADVLRMPQRMGQLTEFAGLTEYLARACGRPGFVKAREDQIAHFRAGDARRG